jgi:transposase
VLQETSDDGRLVERVAALDIGKAEVVCCVWAPGPSVPGGRTPRLASARANHGNQTEYASGTDA